MKVSVSIERYLVHKRANGLSFDHGESCFLRFLRSVGDLQLSQLERRHVLTFLDEPRTSTVTWRGKYQLLEQFFAFWSHHEIVGDFLMPPSRPAVPQVFVPCVYTSAELRALLRAVTQTHNLKSVI